MIWIDAQLSPDLAPWLKESFSLDAKAVRDVGLREADDREIYESANEFLKRVLKQTLPEALSLLKQGEPLVEIRN